MNQEIPNLEQTQHIIHGILIKEWKVNIKENINLFHYFNTLQIFTNYLPNFRITSSG